MSSCSPGGVGVGVSKLGRPLCRRIPWLLGCSWVPVPPREVTSSSQLALCDHCRLRPPDSEQRERVWSLLRGLLETYSHLREEDQSFAVEVPCHRVSLAFRTSQGCETARILGCGKRL